MGSHFAMIYLLCINDSINDNLKLFRYNIYI